MRSARLVKAATRLVPRNEHAWDVAIGVVAAILFVISWPTLFVTHEVSDSVAPVIAAAGVLPLLLLRLQPFVGWATSAAAAALVAVGMQPLSGYDFPWHVVHFMVLLALLFAVALTAPAREIGIAWFGTEALFLAFLPWALKPGWMVAAAGLTVVALLLRWLVLSQRQLARQKEASELERARRSVLEERSRIARDLHDVVAHSMSMVVVQAQSAPQRLGGVSTEVQREFDSIGQQAREALNEVRGMLGVLRSDGQLAEEVPQPGLGHVESLLRDTRDAGIDLTWSVTGSPEGLSDASAMVVVRVLQESLANASRHAPGARVQVEVEYGAEDARISVLNSAGSPEEKPPGSRYGGTGLTGMRTRVHALGGRVSAGSTPEGGFAMYAAVPKAVSGGAGLMSPHA